jgi:PKD repeat protein
MKAIILSLLIASAALCASAQNTFQVINLSDSGPGSLREAIATAVSGDIIDMRGIEGTILLQSPITISFKGVSILGPGKDKLKLSGQGATRIFSITTINNKSISISGVSIVNGKFDDFGGCVFANGGGRLNFNDVEFKDCICNRLSNVEALGGAMAAANDSLSIENCQFVGNLASSISIGGSVGAALHTQVTHLSINSSSFYNNTAFSLSGNTISAVSIRPRVSGGSASFQINNSTFSGNAGAFTVEGSKATISSASTLTGVLKNCTFAFNTGVVDVISAGHTPRDVMEAMSFGNCLFNSNGRCGPLFSSTLTSLGGNLFECVDFVGPDDLSTNDVVVEQLADNGGPTMTHALKEGTIAINSGRDDDPPPFDQRGQPRVQNGQIDIGAYESAFNNFSADFSFSTDCRGLTQFLNTSNDPHNEIVSFLWDFGDGATSAVENPEAHQYANSGHYSVRLVVKSALMLTSTKEKTITVEGAPPIITIAGNNPVTIFVNQTYEDEGATAHDEVDGDLTTSIVETSNLINTTVGTYAVVYTITDGCGLTSSATRVVEVVPIPYPEINLGPDKILCAGGSTLLDAGSGFTGYLWSTGETTSSILITKSGSYAVTVTNHYNFSASDVIVITLVSLPEPVIGVEVVPCENAVFISVANFATYDWSSGSTTQSIKVTQTGTYAIDVSDSNGCEGKDKINVVIPPGPPCQQGLVISAPAVTALCSDSPALLRRWKITNPNAGSLRVDWEILGSIEKTWIDIPSGISVLTTITVPFNANVLKLYWHNEKGEKQSLQQSSVTTRCQKTTASSKRMSTATEGTREDISDNATRLNAYPNPGKSQITVEVRSDRETESSLQIISLAGVVHSRTAINLSEGSNFIVHDISKLPQGSYLIRVGAHTTRFVKE